MKKIILFIILSCINIAVQAYSFQAKNSEGKTIYYKYVSKEEKTVAVASYASGSVNANAYSGKVIIPASVTYKDIVYTVVSIGARAMNYCNSLEEVTLPESITSIDESAFAECSALRNVTIPNSVTSIGGSAFSCCKSLSQIIIPESITSIETNLFYRSALSEITIPANVRSINDDAFLGCTNLKTIRLSQRPPACGNNVFSSVSFEEAELIIPSSMYSAYISSPTWMNFINISTFDDSGASEIETCADPQVSFSDKTLSISCETPNAQIHYSYYLSNVGTVESGEQIPAVTKMTNAITVIAYATADDHSQSKTVIQTFPFDATAYDINGDNRITISDVTTLIDVIVNQ